MEKCKRCGAEMLTFDKRVIYCPDCKKTPVGDKIITIDCLFCGKSIMSVNTDKITMHRECLIDNFYERIAHGDNMRPRDYVLAEKYHIDLRALRKEVFEDKVGRL